jgi:hypothetical protein
MSALTQSGHSRAASGAPSVALYVTFDDRLNVLPLIDLSGVFCRGHMRRREFLDILGWTAVWPVASKAQTTERTRVIGVLEILGTGDPESKTRSEVFA